MSMSMSIKIKTKSKHACIVIIIFIVFVVTCSSLARPTGSLTLFSTLINLHHGHRLLPTHRTTINLPRALHTRTDMATRIKQRILILRVADLAQAHLLIGHFPIANALSVAFSIAVAAHVLVPRLALDKRALPVPLVLLPVTLVRVAGRVLHSSLALAVAEDEVAGVRRARVGDVRAVAVPLAVLEVAGVVVAAVSGFDGLCACKGAGWVSSPECPVVEDEFIGGREEACLGKFLAPVATLIIIGLRRERVSNILIAIQILPHNKTLALIRIRHHILKDLRSGDRHHRRALDALPD